MRWEDRSALGSRNLCSTSFAFLSQNKSGQTQRDFDTHCAEEGQNGKKGKYFIDLQDCTNKVKVQFRKVRLDVTVTAVKVQHFQASRHLGIAE